MNTYETLQEILVREYEVDAAKLRPEAPLEQIGLDSLGVMELMFKIEDVFGVRLPPEETPVDTVQDVVDLIERLQALPQTDHDRAAGTGHAASHGVA